MPGFFSHFHNPFGLQPAPAPASEPAKARKRTPRARKTQSSEGQSNG